MKADLHLHSYPHTSASFSDARDMILMAVERGLKAVSFVDVGRLRGGMEMSDLVGLGEVHGLRVFSGAEIETNFGPVLIYGIMPEITRTLESGKDAISLLHWVRQRGGATVVPHLFRGRDRDESARIISGDWKWWLRFVDAFELTWNSDHSTFRVIEDIADSMRKRVVRGTDAHLSKFVGKGAGELPDEVRKDDELVAWLRSSG